MRINSKEINTLVKKKMMDRYLKTDLVFDYATYQSLVESEANNINDYIKQLSQFLKDKQEQLNEPTEESEATEWIALPDGLADDLGKFFENTSNKTIYNALFVMINSFLEWSIIELCRFADIYINEDFRNYTNDRGLDKANKYLKDKLGIFIAGSANWQLFRANQDVRNLIVHNGANLIKDYSKGIEEQPDFDVFKRNAEHFEYTSTGFIFILKMKYITDSHNKAREFIAKHANEVFQELKKRQGK